MQDKLSNIKSGDEMNVETTEASLVEDNYMNSLSDIDIIDAIVNPEGWSDEELSLAREISIQRDLKPTAKLIQSLQKDKDAINNPKFAKLKTLISGGTFWFLWIAFLTGMNLVLLIFNGNLHSLDGFGLASYTILDAIGGVISITERNLVSLGIFLNLLMLGIFLWIWVKSRKQHQKAYLAGLIIYGTDTFIHLFAKEWFNITLHIFVLLILFSGYKALLNSKKEIVEED